MLRLLSSVILVLATQTAFANPTPDYSSLVDFFPEKEPIVVSADLTIPEQDGSETVIKAPWYLYRSNMINNSPYILVVNYYQIRATGINREGRSETYVYTFKPSKIVCAANSKCQPHEGGYIDSLPPHISNIYSITVEAFGWFEEANGNNVFVGLYNGFGLQQTR